MVSIFFPFQKLQTDSDCRYFYKIHQKKIWIWNGKKSWLNLINFIYDAFCLNQKTGVDKTIQVNEKLRSITFTSLYTWSASVSYSTFLILWCIFPEPLWISFIMQANDDFDKWLDIIFFLLRIIMFWGFLEEKKILMSCCQWMTMGDGWLIIYWIYIIVYVYHGLCWEACLMNCIS